MSNQRAIAGTGEKQWERVGIFSRGMRRIRQLEVFLGCESTVLNPSAREATKVSGVAGWGLKPSANRAEAYASKHRLPLLRLEDGFLRSVGLGVDGVPPLSLIVDDVGIYYDTTRPSGVSELLNGPPQGENDPLQDPALLERAAHCMRLIADAGLSKYNHAPDPGGTVGCTNRSSRVLVVDQTFGDASVIHGQADARCFKAMYEAALAENPDAEILIKTHPDVVAGRKDGYLGAVPEHPRVTLLSSDLNPRAVVGQVDRVYTVTSQLGLEAVLAGIPVSVFGVPFYAGWGLTDDRVATSHARRARSVEELFAAAYILYPRYVDPASGQRCEIEAVIRHLACQRYWREKDRGRLYCVRFQPWKRRFVRTFLTGPDNQIKFVRSARQAERDGFGADSRLIVWGERERADIRELSERHHVPLERMEDGFLRSTGLGSDITAPMSLIVDGRGMYYDPRHASDLEDVLATGDIDDRLQARARALRKRIVRIGISKYNFGPQSALNIKPAAGQSVVLVPGQVEDDVSIRLGCPGPSTNRGLLEAVRRARPNAYIIYKPHPEILSGNRKGTVELQPDENLWDALADGASVTSCLAVADEVHTLTSLVGFEALLRQLRVVVYGQPFYAGWGLTEDVFPVTRRLSYRRLNLDQLVAGALILYPRYVDPRTGMFTCAEGAVDCLQEYVRRVPAARRLEQPWPLRQLRKLRRWLVGADSAG